MILEEKTDFMVSWLFETLAPSVRFEAQKIEREQKPSGGKTLSSSGQDHVEAFDRRDDDAEPHKKFRKDRRDFGSSGNGAAPYNRYNNEHKPMGKFGQRKPFEGSQYGSGMTRGKFGGAALGKRTHDEMNCDLDQLIRRDRFN